MSDNAWYRLKEYSTRDIRCHSGGLLGLPIDSIVRVVACHKEENGWFLSVSLAEHPKLNAFDEPRGIRFYFGVRLEPIDDLELFRLYVERSKQHVSMV